MERQELERREILVGDVPVRVTGDGQAQAVEAMATIVEPIVSAWSRKNLGKSGADRQETGASLKRDLSPRYVGFLIGSTALLARDPEVLLKIPAIQAAFAALGITQEDAAAGGAHLPDGMGAVAEKAMDLLVAGIEELVESLS